MAVREQVSTCSVLRGQGLCPISISHDYAFRMESGPHLIHADFLVSSGPFPGLRFPFLPMEFGQPGKLLGSSARVVFFNTYYKQSLLIRP